MLCNDLTVDGLSAGLSLFLSLSVSSTEPLSTWATVSSNRYLFQRSFPLRPFVSGIRMKRVRPTTPVSRLATSGQRASDRSRVSATRRDDALNHWLRRVAVRCDGLRPVAADSKCDWSLASLRLDAIRRQCCPVRDRILAIPRHLPPD